MSRKKHHKNKIAQKDDYSPFNQMKKTKQKKRRKNKFAQKNDYSPFNQMWFWLRLASIQIRPL